MKKFAIAILLISILITNINCAYAINYATAEEPFFVVHEYYDEYCIIEGSIYRGNENTIVILWIGEDDYPIYVRDTYCSSDGWFAFTYNFPDTLKPGKYKYRLGSNAGTGVYEDYLTYSGKTKEGIEFFTSTTLSLNFVNFEPTVVFNIDCLYDVSAELSIVDEKNNIVYANTKVDSGKSPVSIKFKVPDTRNSCEYKVDLRYYNNNETLVKVSGILKTGTFIKLNGTVEAGKNEIDMLSTIYHNDYPIDSFNSYTGTKSISKDILNIGRNGNLCFYIDGKKYHSYQSGNNVNMFDNQILYETLRKIRPDFDSDLNRVIEPYELDDLKGKLDLSHIGISDITGLERCENITELDISSNQITDISQLFVLDNLKILNASDNNIVSITRLPENLYSLNVNNNCIESFDNLNNYENLSMVCAQNNDISSISGLNQCKDLRYVDLSNNRIMDISPLGQCKNLMHLDLSQNDISSISSLYGKKNLTYLDMSDNNISDISNLPDNMYHTLDLRAKYITEEQIGEFSAIHKKHLPVKQN